MGPTSPAVSVRRPLPPHPSPATATTAHATFTRSRIVAPLCRATLEARANRADSKSPWVARECNFLPGFSPLLRLKREGYMRNTTRGATVGALVLACAVVLDGCGGAAGA